MVKYVPLSPAKHAGRRWCRPFHFGFASQATVVAITGAEIANAATNMPIAFVKEANRFQLVGVLSYQKGRNLFVGPDGRWIGTYTPAVFRTHPFRFLRLPDAETLVLCVDEESHLIEEGRGTEPFFDDAGHRSRSLDAVVAVSGPVDLITDGRTTVRVANGHELLTRVTGAGCALGAVMAAFAAVTDDRLVAATAASCAYAVAAEEAAARTAGPGSFAVGLLDALAGLSPRTVAERARLELTR